MGVAIALGTATLVNAYKNLEQRLLDAFSPDRRDSAPGGEPEDPAPPPPDATT